MNKIISIGIIAVVAVLAVAIFMFTQGNVAPPADLPLSTQTAESASTTTETLASNFVDEATPTADQVLPDLV